MIGVPAPAFSSEHEIDRLRRATRERAVDYPVGVDNSPTDHGIRVKEQDGGMAAEPQLYQFIRQRVM